MITLTAIMVAVIMLGFTWLYWEYSLYRALKELIEEQQSIIHRIVAVASDVRKLDRKLAEQETVKPVSKSAA